MALVIQGMVIVTNNMPDSIEESIIQLLNASEVQFSNRLEAALYLATIYNPIVPMSQDRAYAFAMGTSKIIQDYVYVDVDRKP